MKWSVYIKKISEIKIFAKKLAKKKSHYRLFLVLVLGIAACRVYTSVNTTYDHSADFTQYKTFALLPDSGIIARKDSFRNSAYDNDVIRNNAKNYIIQELNQRGYRLEVEKPDLLIHLVLLNEKKQRIIRYPVFEYSPYYFSNRWYYPYYYPYYDYYTYYGWGCNSYYCDNFPTFEQTYVHGTIIVNMYDRKYEKLVWTGSAEGDIYDPAYIQRDIHPAIQRIIKKFPERAPNKSEQAPLHIVRQ